MHDLFEAASDAVLSGLLDAVLGRSFWPSVVFYFIALAVTGAVLGWLYF